MNSLVARHAIEAVGKIALRLPARANICVDKLLSLLNLEIDYVTSEALVVMTSEYVSWEEGLGEVLNPPPLFLHVDILRKFDNMVEVILPQLPNDFDSITDPEGKAALLWILGEYGEVET